MSVYCHTMQCCLYFSWLSIDFNDTAYRDISYIHDFIAQHNFLFRL